MKDIINSKVKFRESFRPFAPVITYEDMKDYFEGDHEVPYMLHVFPIKKNQQQKIAGVCHVDGSGRLQTVKREQNRRYHKLIKEFEKHSKIPVLLNTSYNIRGEPIVNTPKEAINCFLQTGIDYLIFPNILVSKN